MRLPLLLVSALLMLCAGPEAYAQEPAELFPYAPGNTWTYENVGVSFATSPPTETVVGYTQVEVLRDTLVAGRPGALYTVTRLDASKRLLVAHDCTGYRDDEALRWYVMPRDCVLGEDVLGQDSRRGVYYLHDVVPGGSINVGGDTYGVSGLSDFGVPCAPLPQTSCDFRWKHAGDIGLYYWHTDVSTQGSRNRTEGRLLYAQVGSLTVGVPAVANVSRPQPLSTAFSVNAFPNPSQGLVRLTFRGAATGAITLTLYDLLGRRVRSYEGRSTDTLPIDLGALPGGVYILRARDLSGAGATVFLTRGH